jgi:DivIVA domain-containing protein
MEITPRELRDVEIRESFRGYHRDDVNELLERAAASLEAANERMQQMNERLTTAASETGHTRETEDILHRTLLLAQRAADEAVGEATAKARQMLDDAEIQSRRLISEAEADARRRGEIERRRLEEEILDLAGRRDALLADVEALTRFEADYRDRMVRALDADLTALRSRPPASPGARPEPSEVELPVLAEGFARRDDAETPPAADTPFSRPQPAPEPAAAPAKPDWATAPSGPSPASPAPSSPAPPPAPFAVQTPTPPPAPPQPRAPEDRATGFGATPQSEPPPGASTQGAPTEAVDVQSLFDRAGAGASAGPLAFEQAAEPARSVSPVASPPMPTAPGGDAVDAEVLDDDAFFATLREAVHDDTPLGPRDEETPGEAMFFDQEAESAGFKDVFRRRR